MGAIRMPSGKRTHCHFYVVLETELRNIVVTEKLSDGTVIWIENPKNIEFRNGLAKVFSFADCQRGSVSVRTIKGYHLEESRRTSRSADLQGCKHYAHAVYGL